MGVSTIRAFGVESRFMEEVLTKVDDNNTAFYFLWMCNRWLSIRVDFMGALVTFCAGMLIVPNFEKLGPSWAGLSLGAAMNFMELIYVSGKALVIRLSESDLNGKVVLNDTFLHL